jgi:hypothetical protein
MLHWTERSPEDFLYRIIADLATQVEGLTGKEDCVEKVHECLEETNLLDIITMIREHGLKISIVAYFDNDPQNKRGPINSEVFSKCWEKMGKPKDFFDLDK